MHCALLFNTTHTFPRLFPCENILGKRKKNVKKPEMLLTVQTQVTCLISESENPSLPNTSSSKTTELYGLYGENALEFY